ncbi:MAG: diaminopimelate epimerase [Betaproteobacteria bacterium TMED100]|nr:MAG: diaminopimelate epimerase [Betaproteobacteria bacterium TMED100]
MNIPFIKMQGIGNDFIVLSPFLGKLPEKKLTRHKLKLIANRHFGVGADQILIVKSCLSNEAEYEYEIINSDGGQVEQCGNGARCVMKFLSNISMLSGSHVTLKSKAGIVTARILDDLNICIQMTVPEFKTSDVGLKTELLERKKIGNHEIFSIRWRKKNIQFFPVSMGNPHAVITLDSIQSPEIKDIYDFINKIGIFESGINLGFFKVMDQKTIDLRVFERGCGETLACGSGACAAVVAGVAQNLLIKGEPVKVNLPGGSLSIFWSGGLNDKVFMSGPAEEVFRGTFQL